MFKGGLIEMSGLFLLGRKHSPEEALAALTTVYPIVFACRVGVEDG